MDWEELKKRIRELRTEPEEGEEWGEGEEEDWEEFGEDWEEEGGW
jgi:hypothetical protein